MEGKNFANVPFLPTQTMFLKKRKIFYERQQSIVQQYILVKMEKLPAFPSTCEMLLEMFLEYKQRKCIYVENKFGGIVREEAV